jgi:hypothetical protein
MKYFQVNQALEVAQIADQMPAECVGFNPDNCPWYRQADGRTGPGWLNRNDIDLFMLAQQIADSASRLGTQKYIATDAGPTVSPRYDVKEAPACGVECSMAFNGDYYPVGTITKIGKDYKQITVDGPRGVLKFYRRKLSGAWVSKGMWALVPGFINKFNAEF